MEVNQNEEQLALWAESLKDNELWDKAGRYLVPVYHRRGQPFTSVDLEKRISDAAKEQKWSSFWEILSSLQNGKEYPFTEIRLYSEVKNPRISGNYQHEIRDDSGKTRYFNSPNLSEEKLEELSAVKKEIEKRAKKAPLS